MADTQYKIVGTKYYVYPNTELEASFVAGEADFPSGYELYMNVTSYYKVLEKYTDNVDHIHQYDYYLHCVRVPEWTPDSPTPPTPTPQDPELAWSSDEYTATIGGMNAFPTLSNPHSVDVAYTSSDNEVATIDSSTGEITLVAEGTTTISAVFDGDETYEAQTVTYSLTAVEASVNYTISVVNQDEVRFDLYDNDWNAITGPIPEGTYVNALLKNRAYKVTSNDIYLVDQDWNTQYNQYHYTFIMPGYDITLTVSARAVNDINISNPDSIPTELFTRQWEPSTGEDVYEGQGMNFYVADLGYQATFTGVTPIEEQTGDGKWKYMFRMPDTDVDIVVEQRQSSDLSVNLTDPYNINPTIFKNRGGWTMSDWHDLLEGDLVSIQWQTQGYALTSNDVSINTFWEGSESTWKAQFTMPSTDVDVTMDVGVLPAPISFSESSSTAYLQDTNVYPSLVNDESLTVSYGSSDTGVATIDPSTGEITLVDEGTTTISASFAGDSTFSSTTTTFTLTVVNGLRPRNIFPINNNTTASDTLYDITKDAVIAYWYDQVTAGDQMALIDGNNVGSSYNAKVLYKDGLNNWTTLTTTQDTITYNDETMYCVKFTIPATVQDGDYLLYIGSSEDLYDISINVGGVLYNDDTAWWYTEEDPNNQGTYNTKYPENCNLGIESREGQTYTINPPQTQEQGGSVGMYIVMPATDIEITRTNI